ncbi:MAG: ATP-dependent DNA helicase RecG [Candidatus Rokubacteria bacterium]|nr:ATP-dependent DNA helicase RecG [Candidatus Rokubacteria bacterium]
MTPARGKPGRGSAVTRAHEPVGARTALGDLAGVGPQRAKALARLGLATIEDALVQHLPLRHEDRSRIIPLGRVSVGEARTCAGTIAGISPPPRGRPRMPLVVMIRDVSGFLNCAWFNQPYLARVFKRGQRLIVHGKVQPYGRGPLQMLVKDYEVVEDGPDEMLHTGRLVPVYPLTEGLTQRPFRRLMKRLVDGWADQIDDPLPDRVREGRALSPLPQAIRGAHFPETQEEQAAAHRRLVFDDFFLLEVGLAIRRHREGRRRGLAMNPPGALVRRLRASLPYTLTAAQERVWGEIRTDMAEPYPMSRLLQGDVGSGKTVVAALAILTAIESGYQAALMAPTEILAEQHMITLSQLLEPLGVGVVLLTGAVKGKARQAAAAAAERGEAGCVIGTHALVQGGVGFKRLGLAVIDEQHRFGVAHRAAIRGKGESPDVLVMTATPIPRTLALTLYGDLDVSVLDELPPGRRPVVTVARGESKRREIYDFLRKQIGEGRQVYVVCPLVEESEASDLRAATEMAERLQREVFPERRVGLLHGRLGFQDKERVMREFKEGAVHVLVSTTVIEVGIDVPNAAVMLVEHAERFGLSQLHQLRGRVGRGSWKSYCILLAGSSSEDAQRRIAAMTGTNDGFRIAEVDLELRGPGDFFGTRQSGLPEFRVADLLRDGAMLEEARREAFALVHADPQLTASEHRGLREALLARWRGKLDLAGIG